jgi:16S rRNA G966 N2-methylase RsmD
MYVAKASAKERPKVDGVAHSTVKPLALMRWLVRLVTPPGGVCLDMFAGSGTTLEACLINGMRGVGIEQDETYWPLIQVRLERQARVGETSVTLAPSELEELEEPVSTSLTLGEGESPTLVRETGWRMGPS